MDDLNKYKLHIEPEDARYIPRGHIAVDAKYFDYDSLVMMYGQEAVDNFVMGQYENRNR